MQASNPSERGLLARFAPNSLAVLASQMVNNLLAAAFAVVFVRHFGREQYGVFTTVFTYLSCFSVLQSLGVDTIMLREISRDRRALDDLGAVAGLRIALSLATMSASWCLLPLIQPTGRVAALVILASLSTPLSFYPLYTMTYIVDLKMAYPNLVFAAWALIYTVARIAMVLADMSLEAFVVVSLVSDAVTFFAARKLGQQSGLHLRIRFDWAIAGRLLSQSWSIAFAFVSLQLLLRIDQLMLYRMHGPGEVGLYAVPVRVVEFANVIPTVFMASAFPLLARLAAGVDGTRLAFATRMSFRAMACAALPLAAYLFAYPEVCLRVLFGQEFEAASGIMSILAFSPVFAFLNSILFNRLLAAGQQGISAALAAAAAGLNVGLNLVLIPSHGGEGAAVATLVAYGSVPLLAMALEETRGIGWMAFQSLVRPGMAAGMALLVVHWSAADPLRGALFVVLTYFSGLVATRELGLAEVRVLCAAAGWHTRSVAASG